MYNNQYQIRRKFFRKHANRSDVPKHRPRTDLPDRAQLQFQIVLESSWNVMAHGDAREEKWRGNWRMEWVASTLHTTSKLGVFSITTADTHTSAASSRLNWRPRRFKWTRPFRRKTKSGFCACAITFQTQSTNKHIWTYSAKLVCATLLRSWIRRNSYVLAVALASLMTTEGNSCACPCKHVTGYGVRTQNCQQLS